MLFEKENFFIREADLKPLNVKSVDEGRDDYLLPCLTNVD
jgi:hypothetical protein